MNPKIVYSKTGKGVLEIKNKAGKLSRDLAKVLALIDGKSSVADLVAKSKLSDADIGRVLSQLEDRGYIKEFSSLSGRMSSTSSAGSSAYVDDLDFTRQLSPGKRVYSSSQAEMRARESAEREQAEADAKRKRDQADQEKKTQAAQQARDEAARLARIEAERKTKEAAALKAKQEAERKKQQEASEMQKTTRDLAKILEAERQALEKSSRQKKEEQARRSKDDAVRREGEERQLREEEARKQREEEERKRREAEERKRREEEARKQREEEERKRREEEARKRREEEERKRREEEERKRREEEERKRREEEERKRREEEERKRREEEERKRREEEERKRREEEERKQREEEERKQREEEERKRREEEERKRREEEERKRREEEERKRREEEQRQREEEERQREEEERKRREEEDRRREEEDRRREEEDRRREEEQRKRREEEGRRRDDEERKRREEEDRRREEEDRKRREEDDRRREEEEARRRKDDERMREEEERAESYSYREEKEESPSFDFGSFDLPSVSESGEDSTAKFEMPEETPASASESSFDLPSLDNDSSGDFTADFDRQQELRRKQEAEEDQRRREAEEARTEMERQRREEEAREEASRRAAMEAEMRARVDQEKTERAERQRAKEEEYQRKIEQDEERKRAEVEQQEQAEFQRKETERKQREDDLARRRRESEEMDRKRAELKRLQKSGRIRSPAQRARPFIIGVVVLVALVLGGIQIMPMSGYIPSVEKIASESIGEPVTIGSMKMSMLSGLELKFSNVKIGTTQDVTLSDVVVKPELASLFGNKVRVNSIQADGGTAVREVVERLPRWLDASMANKRIEVRAISLHNLKLEMRTFTLPALNIDVNFRRDGAIVEARVATADGKVTVDIGNSGGDPSVNISAASLTLPIGAPLQLTDFTGTGTISGSTLTLSEWDASLYGGQAKGNGQLSWSGQWRLASRFEFVRIETEQLLDVFSDTAKVTGASSGQGNLSAVGGNIDTLLDRPSLQASFVVKKGTIDGADLVRALQAGPGGAQGGSTRFEELKGDVSVSNGRFSYQNVVLSAGILSASSNFYISGDQELSGRVYVALNSPANRLSSNLNISGTLKGATLRP